MCGAAVRSSVWITHRMGKLMLDKIGPDAKHFVENHSRYRPKPCLLMTSLSIPKLHIATSTCVSLIGLDAPRPLGNKIVYSR
jgi:hypothetical protein